ncbi:XIAP-associated factor 1 [Urocitellus parryii]|uniref:XIAP associated factor 1 n=1 Tax=Urocitellus parryii TaxID=9999 RepID=A0A8D2I889_UROPR|nr:XIAP-associated factor 1 [Urocitellus parryii]
MEGDFQVCRNCRRSVASAHFTLHEAHCLRFLVLCPECEEPIPQSKMKEHFENEHQQTEERQQDSIQCKFCELTGSLKELQIHESRCDKQTECCLHCGQFIRLQVLARHQEVCPGRQAQLGKGKRISAPERKIHRDYYNQKYSENESILHRGKCCSVSESGKHHPSGKPKILPLSLPSETAGNQTSTTERDVRPKTRYRNKFPHFPENSTQKAQRNKNRTVNLPLKAEHKPRTAFPTEDEAAYDILRMCSQCGILLPLPTLCQHQEKCLRLASWKGKQVRKSS